MIVTDNEIIKALECCGNQMWFCTDKQCRAKTLGNALDLINRQKAEIERLKSLERNVYETVEKLANKIKVEARKEFAERLKKQLQWDVEYENKIVFDYDIDNLVKEMERDNNA